MVRTSPAVVVAACLFAACGGSGSDHHGIGLKDLNADGEVRILCFGDSITQGYGDNPGEPASAPPGGFGGYPLRLQAATGVTVINAGVGGERTSEGIGRLPQTLDQNKPDYVILDEGINDLGDGDENIALDNLQSMVETIFQHGAQPLLGTLLPTCCDHIHSEDPGRIGDFNNALRAIAQNDKIPVIEFHEAFVSDPFGPVDPNSGLIHVPEGLHPTPKGYDVMGRTARRIF